MPYSLQTRMRDASAINPALHSYTSTLIAIAKTATKRFVRGSSSSRLRSSGLTGLWRSESTRATSTSFPSLHHQPHSKINGSPAFPLSENDSRNTSGASSSGGSQPCQPFPVPQRSLILHKHFTSNSTSPTKQHR